MEDMPVAKDDLISRAAALDAISTEGGCGMCARRVLDIPAVDAVPVEWMRDKMRGYASSLKSTETAALVMVMQMWQKEQEAR